MIPVAGRRPPKGFNKKVFRPGRRWLRKNNLPLKGPVPKDAHGKTKKLKAYWRRCLRDLHACYDGVCAYSSMYIEVTQGAATVDHFIAKTIAVEEAYRWRNYRLASLTMNGRKGISRDVLDPFTLAPETFSFDTIEGRISPNPSLSEDMQKEAQATIDRLGLDNGDFRQARLSYFEAYIQNRDANHLRKHCPFVWFELGRQGLL